MIQELTEKQSTKTVFYERQLEDEISILKETLEEKIKLLEDAQKREARMNMQISKLKSQIQKQNVENHLTTLSNPRGAGRKPKFNSEQINNMRQLREQGVKITEIANRFYCSVGLVHKLINENK